MMAKLKALQAEIDAMRRKLGVGLRDEVLYLAALDVDDEMVIVEADGFGGATTKVVEGNYPIDFFTHYEKSFATESAALEAAESLFEDDVSFAEVLS